MQLESSSHCQWLCSSSRHRRTVTINSCQMRNEKKTQHTRARFAVVFRYFHVNSSFKYSSPTQKSHVVAGNNVRGECHFQEKLLFPPIVTHIPCVYFTATFVGSPAVRRWSGIAFRADERRNDRYECAAQHDRSQLARLQHTGRTDPGHNRTGVLVAE